MTPIAGMGHLISEPKLKIPTTPAPLLISDKSLSFLLGSQTTVAKKCDSKHWFSCGADGRSAVGVRSRDYQIFWDG